jgi:hypothetical protein
MTHFRRSMSALTHTPSQGLSAASQGTATTPAAPDNHPKANAGVFIREMTLQGGTSLVLQDDSIVVFVGPNNSGKSLTLREIFQMSAGREHVGRWITGLQIQRMGDEDKLLKMLSPFRREGGEFQFSESRFSSLTESEIKTLWVSDKPYLGKLTDLFFNHMTTERRLADCSQAEAFDALERRYGTHPIHNLYLDFDLEVRISRLFRRAFATDLVVHRSAGRTIPLFVGERPHFDTGENPVSRTYLDKIEALERLEDQGDGLKSFASLLLRVWTGHHSVLLLDEPEAFLHPPQARAVGELIATGIDREKQIFVATHSNDVIQGLLSRFPGRVSVVRLERSSKGPIATYLPSEQIAELWRDPILRYSNVLNGLFHGRVVVTESDGDCKFYEAVASTLPQPLISTFYTYGGGKDRLPVIVRAMRALHVPVRSVVDLDIIADDGPIRRLLEAHGRSWNEFEADVKHLRAVIQSKKAWLVGSGFKARVSDVLKQIDDEVIVQRPYLDRIREAMRETSPWESVKTAGVAMIPPGEPNRRVRDLLGRFQQAGIFVVPVGEMEGFCRSVGGKGPKWVEAVLTRDLEQDAELKEARDFVFSLSLEGDESFILSTPNVPPRRFASDDFFYVDSKFNRIVRTIGNVARAVLLVLLAGCVAFVFLSAVVQTVAKP